MKQLLQVGKARPVSRVGSPATPGEGIQGLGAEVRPWEPGSVLLEPLQDEVWWDSSPGLLTPGKHLP